MGRAFKSSRKKGQGMLSRGQTQREFTGRIKSVEIQQQSLKSTLKQGVISIAL